jgi:hypothetical protein
MGAGRHPARCFLYGRVSFVVTRLLLIALPSKVCTLMASERAGERSISSRFALILTMLFVRGDVATYFWPHARDYQFCISKS